MKVNFLRKATKNELLPQNEFVVEKVLELEPDEFNNFINRMLADHEFIAENKDLMYIDELGVWHVIFVTTKDIGYGILIESEGYNYARYSAYITKKEIGVSKNE